MSVTQAFCFGPDPNRVGRFALVNHVGAARFASNWGPLRRLKAPERGPPASPAFRDDKKGNR
jgi:putative transposase